MSPSDQNTTLPGDDAPGRHTSTPTVRHKHVLGLDILRLFAATLVMIYHFGFWNWTGGQPLALALPGQAPDWGPSLHFGWVGVEIFFVISGFVIAYTVSDARPGAFLRSRFLRLAPASWIAATLVLAIHLAIGTIDTPRLLIHYVETLVFWPLDAIDGVWWTLGIEIDFYLLAYMLIRKGRQAALEPILVCIGASSGIFWIFALTLQATLQGHEGILGTLYGLVLRAQGNRELQLLLVQHGSLFALGVVLWTASTAGLTVRRAALIGILMAACLLEIVGQTGIIARAARMSLPVMPAILTWLAAMLFLVLSIALNSTVSHWVGRRTGVIRFIGLATYPLYLTHDVVGLGVILVLAPRLGLSSLIVGLVAAFAVAAIIAKWLEPALRGVLSRRLAVAAPPRPAPGE